MARMMRADVVIGADSRNSEDQKLGEIMDIVIDPRTERIAYVLVYRGDFLGMGRELVAVRWRDLRATEDHEIYVLNTPKTAFMEAPMIDRASFEKSDDEAWRESLERFWSERIGG
jgi:sporulation protein YlmC with PRC-barrel domain